MTREEAGNYTVVLELWDDTGGSGTLAAAQRLADHALESLAKPD
jgi:hypothetical protein